MFGPNPKSQVNTKLVELFGKKHGMQVTGRRVGKQFICELIADDRVLATAAHSDWRKAYKMLKIRVENIFAEGQPLV